MVIGHDIFSTFAYFGDVLEVRGPVTEPLLADATLLSLAQAGDGEAFGKLTDPFRRELQVHCYRMLGSAHDAEDLLQETLIAAWRGIGQFEGRSSLRAWLYRIATNQCLNALRGSKARALAARRGAAGGPGSGTGAAGLPALPEPASDDEPTWLEPYPDELLAGLPDAAPGPEARYESRESISLAFVTALQHLTPRQRAALVLRDALGYRAAEAAEILDCSLDTVNGSLKRARAALSAAASRRHAQPGAAARVGRRAGGHRPVHRRLRARRRDHARVHAHRRRLAHHAAVAARIPRPGRRRRPADDAGLPGRHPPLPARPRPRQPAAGVRLLRLRRPSRRAASGQGMIVPTLAGNRICGVTRFLDNGLLDRFGLPASLPG